MVTSHGLRILLLVTVCLSPGCIVFHDQAGVPLDRHTAHAITVGMPRAEVLEVVGSPTGVYSTRLLSLITGFGDSFDDIETQGRRDDDILTWQHIEARARIAFFPILFAHGRSRIHTRTLMVFFDPDGRVEKVAYREDAPE
jgi:outer membrane protein assembly factor BamE (lipoprotein component of BamABCDE complex)